MIVSFGGLAGQAGAAILVNLPTELGPPIPSADVVHGPLGSQVPEHLMCLGNDLSNNCVIFDLHVGHTEDLLSITVVSV